MKNCLFCLLTLSSIFSTSCDRDKTYSFNYCTAIINNEVWNASNAKSYKTPYHRNEAIDIKFMNVYPYYPFSIIFKKIRKNYDKQTVYGVAFSSQESDVTGDEYRTLESDSANNWVQIIKARKDFTRDIEGKFSGTFVREKSYPYSPFPDTLRIREGYFFIAKEN